MLKSHLTQAYEHITEGKENFTSVHVCEWPVLRQSAKLGHSYLRGLCYLYVCQENIILPRQCCYHSQK